jgi:hypothetical protein
LADLGNIDFRSLGGLTSVVIGDGVTQIGDDAFQQCHNLASVVIGNGVTNIGFRAFFGCDSLSSVVIGTNVATIGDMAFEMCLNLAELTIPGSVERIGSGAFFGCDGLAGLYCMGGAPVADGDLFDSQSVAVIYHLPGAAGWPPVPELWAGRPTALWLPEIEAEGLGAQAGRFQFNLGWAAGQTVVVEACTNLVDPVWVPVGTNTLAGGTGAFRDDGWTNHGKRIYRIRRP